MIFFPFIYSDELLYSAFARYHSYSGNISKRSTMQELFGYETVCATTLFPTHLKALSQRLPSPEIYSPEYFIQKHTCLPYYTPFIPNNRNLELLMLMIEGEGTSFYMKLGKTASTIKSPKYLKCCIECIKEDRDKNGEAYWHRTHQMEGVRICPNHGSYLYLTDVQYSERQNKHEFISLENCNIKTSLKASNIETENNHLKFISKQTHYLLNNVIEPIGLSKLHDFYITRLQQKGLATFTGRVKWVDFLALFTNYYGFNLLNDLNSYVSIADEDTWLHKLLRKPRVTCNPLRHILLLGFLDDDIQSLINGIKEAKYEPFGSGPWYCLNKAANHYKTPIINSCVITRDSKTGLPVGTFSCICGFVYSRKGPDKSPGDSYKIGRIKEYGEIWEGKFRSLSGANISLRKKAELLGVNPTTVKNKLVEKKNTTYP